MHDLGGAGADRDGFREFQAIRPRVQSSLPPCGEGAQGGFIVSAGHSALVGIGRGDPALLTLRAAELLRAADIVIRDAPIADAILAMIPARAELLASLDDAADVRSAVHAGQRVVWLAS